MTSWLVQFGMVWYGWVYFGLCMVLYGCVWFGMLANVLQDGLWPLLGWEAKSLAPDS